MELSEEEKKAIDIVEDIKFKTYGVYNAKEMRNEIRYYQTEEERKAIDIVLNKLRKQQTEIEELKQELINQGIADLKELNNYIRKDKIREIIENDKENIETLYNSADFDSAYVRAEIERIRLEKEVLEELLEEN